MGRIEAIPPGNIRDHTMKRLGAFLIGFVLFATYAPLAQAQGYYESDGGLYLSARGGLAQVRGHAVLEWQGYDPTYVWGVDPLGNPILILVSRGLNDHLEYRSLEMDYGFVAGAAIGYTMAYPESVADLRFELEGIYRKNVGGEIQSQFTATTNRPDSDSLTGYVVTTITDSLEVRSAMFNVLVDFHTGTRFVPYLGLGAGISQMVADGQTYNEEIYALSWQAIAGIGFRFSPGAMVTLESRYFRLAADRYSNLFLTDELRNIKFDDWSLGFRFTF